MERESTLVFGPDHPAFAGHFPGAPIVPGVLLLDAALHALAQASGLAAMEVASAKFLHPVAPDEPLTLAVQPAEAGRARFDIMSGAQRAAIGQVQLAAVAQLNVP